ncbi:MAG: SPFH domain-containing protein [Candidatus Sericytochromatia bacterium]
MSGWIVLGFIALVVVVLSKLVKIIRQSQQAIVERLGRYSRTLDSGINFLIPGLDRIAFRADLREQMHTFEPQAMITQDNATVYLNAVTYYRITDAAKAFYGVASFQDAIEQLIITTLRNLIGELELDETLTSRHTVNTKLQAVLDEVTSVWGIKVTRVEVKEITPAKDIIEAMSSQMVAERRKRAAILEAEGAKQSAVLKAEGDKLARILEAEGLKAYTVLEASGKAEAAMIEADAQRQALQKLQEAFPAGQSEERVLALKYLEVLPKVAQGKGVSMVIPDRLSNLASLSSLAGQFFQAPRGSHEIPMPAPPRERVP